MASKQTINEILYFGLMDYVPKQKLIEYQNEFASQRTRKTKFALSFFPKYIDFDKAIKKPIHPYDTLLLNYWIVEVPNMGLRGSKLLWDYEFEENALINKFLKNKKKKTKTKLLLTKKQKKQEKINLIKDILIKKK